MERHWTGYFVIFNYRTLSIQRLLVFKCELAKELVTDGEKLLKSNCNIFLCFLAEYFWVEVFIIKLAYLNKCIWKILALYFYPCLIIKSDAKRVLFDLQLNLCIIIVWFCWKIFLFIRDFQRAINLSNSLTRFFINYSFWNEICLCSWIKRLGDKLEFTPKSKSLIEIFALQVKSVRYAFITWGRIEVRERNWISYIERERVWKYLCVVDVKLDVVICE